ncbi:hypothetical protein Pcinc_010667 [Petrolisthes cinctipes]|uniref:Uncharacterized protein n=1 Tax=Petrolisthes cinctipes TaxID=88211 RepID=A0AAE1G4C7_PETCI|nr:hypothetical protein Pcinc_010667 [Petrolisthes cinctipes]
MLGTLADVQVGGLPDIRDPGPSEHDTEEEDEVELPSVELPPGPSVPSVAEPAVMIRSAATSVVDTIIGTPGIPSVGSYQEVHYEYLHAGDQGRLDHLHCCMKGVIKFSSNG